VSLVEIDPVGLSGFDVCCRPGLLMQSELLVESGGEILDKSRGGYP
jgi:hypothetical protein